MSETTSEQLAEIEGQAADIPSTEYTLPEGWQEVPSGEPLKCGDEYHAGLNRYIRPIEPEPQPVQVREGRWRLRNGLVRDVTAMPTNHEDFAAAYPWWDGVSTWRNDGRWLAGGSTMDLLEYLGPIEPQPEPEKSITPDNVAGQALAGVWNQAKAERTIEELRCEVSYVQRLLGESRQRNKELEALVSSLRTINEATEKTVRAAGQENTDLQHRLNVVSAEWAEQVETSRRLQIELDAAQQVPADSPELRQLRLDLAEVTQDRDTYRHAHERVLSDLETIRETTKSETVEAIAEWLQPIRAVDNPNLANETLQHLPQIMRHLTGLEDEGIE